MKRTYAPKIRRHVATRADEVHTRPEVGQPNDPHEQEANAMADRVMRMPSETSEEDEVSPMRGNSDVFMMKPKTTDTIRMVPQQSDTVMMKPQSHDFFPMIPTSGRVQMMEEDERVDPKPEDRVNLQEEEEKVQMQTDEEDIQLMEDDEQVRMQTEEEEVSMKEEDEEMVNKKELGTAAVQPTIGGKRQASQGLTNKINSTKGAGSPLSTETQQELGSKMGADFSSVRIHTDSKAVDMNKELGAKAFAHGKDIYFNQGNYAPGSSEGKHLLAHELTHVMQQRSKETVRSKIQLTAEDEVVEDNTIYYVAVADASIRKEQAPHNVDSSAGNIPPGTKVKRIMRYDGDKRAKVQQLDVGEGQQAATWWTTFSNIKPAEIIEDSGTFTAFYSDITIMNGPGNKAGASENKLTQNAKFKINVKCNGFVKVQPLEGQTSASGWVDEKALHTATDMTRSSKIIEYRTWLDARFTEAEGKTGNDKVSFANGILGQLEIISSNINQDSPVFPDTQTLDKNPSFSTASNADLGTYVPHELIHIARRFIEITEKKQGEATECTDPVVGGSLYTAIDWNTRLGVPQYRSQSDNLFAPEATCAPTSFAMGLERIGVGRSEMVKAIDEKVAPGETDVAVIQTKWKTKFLEYLDEEEQAYKDQVTAYEAAEDSNKAREEIIASNAEITEANQTKPKDKQQALAKVPKKRSAPKPQNYRRVRGGREGIAGNDTHEKEVAGIMRESGQLEDLSDFLNWLNGNSSRSTINLTSQAQAIFRQLHPDVESDETPTAWTSPELGRKNKLGFAYREKIRRALESGNAVVLSVSHKGARAFRGHVITVQSIDGKGLIVDDPYGAWNSAYRRTKVEKADAYALLGSKTRSDDFRNKPAYKDGGGTPSDYSEADFTVKAGQDMKANETLGNSSRIDFDMINESNGIIGQIYIFKKV